MSDEMVKRIMYGLTGWVWLSGLTLIACFAILGPDLPRGSDLTDTEWQIVIAVALGPGVVALAAFFLYVVVSMLCYAITGKGKP